MRRLLPAAQQQCAVQQAEDIDSEPTEMLGQHSIDVWQGDEWARGLMEREADRREEDEHLRDMHQGGQESHFDLKGGSALPSRPVTPNGDPLAEENAGRGFM